MRPPNAATRHVVGRCPRCGVEHDVPAEPVCEACDTALRPWCSRHGREAGWLDGPACPRCAADADLAARRQSPARSSSRDAAPSAATPRQALDPLVPSAVQSAPAAAGAPRPKVAARPVEPTPVPVDWFWYAIALVYLMMFVVCGGLTGLCVALLVGMDSPDVSTKLAIGGAVSGAFLGLCYLAARRGTRWF